MRKLIQFLVRYSTAFLFILLQVVAFSLIYRNASYQQTAMHNMNAEWSGWVLSSYNNIDDYLNLSRINKNLARQNANLYEANKSAYFSLITRRDSITDTAFTQQYTYLAARVINSSFRKRNNYITLNKGTKHGVRPDMAVISEQGVIGIVKDASAHFSSVIPIINGQSLLSVGLAQSPHFGTLSWNGKDFRYAQVIDVPREAVIEVGDSVFSNTRSEAFPSNVLVGTVHSFLLDPEEQTYSIEVELGADFSALDYVFVVDNLLKQEQLELEAMQEVEP